MRTALNSIKLSAALALKTKGLPHEHIKLIYDIMRSGNILNRFVKDILAYSKISSEEFRLVSEKYDTDEIIYDILMQSKQYKKKDTVFNLQISEDFPTQLEGDGVRVSQILCNLLSNAFKHTDTGKVTLHISSTIEEQGVLVHVSIEDTGKGISPEKLETIFQPFVQDNMTSARKVGGTGLGLAIVKKLIEEMGGNITAYSEGINRGSVFYGSFTQKFVTDNPLAPNVIFKLKNYEYSVWHKQQQTINPTVNLPDARVLIVDDTDTNLSVTVGLLKLYKIEAHTAESGEEALQKIKDKTVHYDMIFMDYLMPDMNGIDTIRRIRQIGTEYARKIPIIAITANPDIGVKERFLNIGIQDFISKPVNSERLDEVFKKYLNEKCIAFAEDDTSTDGSELDLFSCFQVDGLDISDGLKNFGDNGEGYLNNLRSFVKTVPNILEQLETKQKTDLDAYYREAHRIYGMLASIGAECTPVARFLTDAAKKGDSYLVNSRYSTLFCEDLKKLSVSIEGAIEQIEEKTKKPKADKPDIQLLKEFFEACEQADNSKMREKISLLDAYVYNEGGAIVKKCKELADKTGYFQIIEGLKNVKEICSHE
jgi:CheY-like chemotaxis protein